MSKSATPRRLDSNQASAKLRNLRISPRKLNLVAQVIRGKHVSEALDQLKMLNKAASKNVYDLLMSAVSNAENNHNLDIDRLYVTEASVGKGLVMKRFHARARGRGVKIMKPHSHMNIVVTQVKESV
jgi:large subunit ribosomal protein L22